MDTRQTFGDSRELYRATAAAGPAAAVGAAAPFTIEVEFTGGLTQSQRDAFKAAADRWVRVIVGDLPNVLVEGEVIDDVLILAQGADIDGPRGVLGQAGPTFLRPPNAGAAASIPAKGVMTFDRADLTQMEEAGTLNDVIVHEMGHVLGSGTIWSIKGLIRDDGPNNPVFIGENAMREYGTLLGTAPRPVPVENTGGPGTRGSHWRESVFNNELMTGFVDVPPNPMSRLTVASLQDMGYQVDVNAAEAYGLPNIQAMAEAGELAVHQAPIDRGILLPTIPISLAEDSIR
jgi:hypothetical protein